MADDRVLEIVLKARDEASKTLKEFGNEAKKTGDSIKSTLEKNVVQLGGAFAGVSGIIGTSIAAFAESEDSIAQLNATLASTKGVAGVTADAVLDLSASLQQQSKFGDEAITNAQSLLLTFTNIGKDVFPDATKTVLDMSQALGQDLKSSSIQLGKALNDPIQGITALSRVGVSFTEQQKEQITTLVESGNTIAAQKVILEELSKEFGGSALASSQTFTGQMERLKNNLGEIQETIGMGILQSLAGMGGGMEGVNTTLINLNKFLGENTAVLMGISVALVAVAGLIGGLFLLALVTVTGASIALVAAIGGATAAVGFLAGVIINQWSGIMHFIRAFKDYFIGQLQSIPGAVGVIFDNAKKAALGKLDELLAGVRGIGESIKRVLDDIGKGISGSVDRVRGFVSNIRIPGFADGGFVKDTGLAMVHSGEYVLSRDMLAGRQPIEAPVNNYGGLTQNIVINQANSHTDIQRVMEEAAYRYKTAGIYR